MSKKLNLKFTLYLILFIIPVTLICVLTVNYFILAWSEPSGPPPDGSITQNLNLNNHKIVNLTAPDLDNDAATKAYVDAAGGGVQYMGRTTTSYCPGCLGGPAGANAKCQLNYAGSHMCFQSEMIKSGATTFGSNGWAHPEAASESRSTQQYSYANYVDSSANAWGNGTGASTCIQWTTAQVGWYAPYIKADGTVGNDADCAAASYPIHCCK